MDDRICEPGYIYQRYSYIWFASQCGSISKITTAAECELATEYIRIMWAKIEDEAKELVGFPPGCYYFSGNNRYYWNDNFEITIRCLVIMI